MSLRRIIFDATLLLEVANCCVETNILRMPRIPLHRLSVGSDCLLIVASRLGYRATVEVMLPDYCRCDYYGERADGKTDQRQSNRHFSVRQTAHCIYGNQQRADRKAGPAEPEEGIGSEKASTRGVKNELTRKHLRRTVIRWKIFLRKNLVLRRFFASALGLAAAVLITVCVLTPAHIAFQQPKMLRCWVD